MSPISTAKGSRLARIIGCGANALSDSHGRGGMTQAKRGKKGAMVKKMPRYQWKYKLQQVLIALGIIVALATVITVGVSEFAW